MIIFLPKNKSTNNENIVPITNKAVPQNQFNEIVIANQADFFVLFVFTCTFSAKTTTTADYCTLKSIFDKNSDTQLLYNEDVFKNS